MIWFSLEEAPLLLPKWYDFKKNFADTKKTSIFASLLKTRTTHYEDNLLVFQDKRQIFYRANRSFRDSCFRRDS